MAAMMFVALFLTVLRVSDAAWCVCRQDASNSALQKTIDYACGAGADCNPILQNGPCYNPNSVLAHCTYAANSYYQRKGQAQGACDFAGTAVMTQTDPSSNGCSYPSSQSAAGSSSSTGNGTSTQNPGSGSSSSGLTPTQSGAGGVLGGLGPSGTATSIDGSDAASLPNPNFSLFLIIFLSGLVFLRL
ncbi:PLASMODESMATA CALLOSE-BINDING PROTEIN 3-like [Phalaenopsis equestris]|uniref:PLASMODESMATA CALLOSE-BINDING PROTEIN 3-like n=1 Tax=Phalaenopsis equestris TaxID=78828 RepID=UPI0009E2E827|nr:PLASMODESMATA CALLOSE-BINDING PROTEIN 3-like [Phalaenopsis equestris]